MSEELIGFITCPPEKGQEISRIVVAEKLVACVNIIPSVRSIYMWQGKIENEEEQMLIVKTTKSKWKQFENRMKEIHPYEVPEIISFSIAEGYPPYLEWLRANVSENAE